MTFWTDERGGICFQLWSMQFTRNPKRGEEGVVGVFSVILLILNNTRTMDGDVREEENE